MGLKVIKRKKVGRGFRYVDDSGRAVPEEKLPHIEKVAIPPAWEQVEISPNPGSKLVATGLDAAGRKQYIYHPKYREQQERKKFDRLLAFANALPMMRKVTGEHLKLSGYPREKVLACMVRLIDQAYFRVGSEQYAKENQTFGIATLRSRHLNVEGDTMIFKFTGKSGQEQHKKVKDSRLAKIVSDLDELPGYEIFKYENEAGEIVDVKSQDLNQYIREVMGSDFTAKDFRTWAGTLIAAMALAEAKSGLSKTKAQREVSSCIKQVAKKLGNTPAIAKASYVDPRVIDHYLNGSTIKWYLCRVNTLLRDAPNEHLSHEEVAVLSLLKRRLKKVSAKKN